MPNYFDKESSIRIGRAVKEVERLVKTKQKPGRRFRPIGGSGEDARLAEVTAEIAGATWASPSLTAGTGSIQFLERNTGTDDWTVNATKTYTGYNSVPDQPIELGKIVQVHLIDGDWFVVVEPCDEPPPGLGGAYMAAVSTPVADLGAAWAPLTLADTERFPASGMTYDILTGQFRYDTEGIWDSEMTLIFSHDESQSSRETNVRVYNTTDAAGTDAAPVGIARQQTVTQVSIKIRHTIDATNTGDVFQWEVGNGDAISAVTVTNLTVNFTRVFTT